MIFYKNKNLMKYEEQFININSTVDVFLNLFLKKAKEKTPFNEAKKYKINKSTPAAEDDRSQPSKLWSHE